MATVNLIKAAARSRAGKGAARSERRSGRVPGIIYGDGKPPLPISLDYADLRHRIYAGHFLTTIHDVEVDGVKHGGTVSIVTHSLAVRCRADAIPSGIEVDVGDLEINHSKHLSDITLPEGVRSVAGRDVT